MNEEDRPGNIHFTGDVEFNERQKRIGTQRYSPGPTGVMQLDDNGQFVDYHNFCAAIRTKVSTIHSSNDQWRALVILAHHIAPETMDEIVQQHRDRHPDSIDHLRTAFDRSRDDWKHYE